VFSILKYLNVKEGWIICSTLYDVNLLVNTNDLVGSDVFYFGMYEPDVINFIKNIAKKGDIIFDIGAYIGDMTCILSKFVDDTGCIFAFEPIDEYFKILNYNIHLNNLNNVTSFNLGLGDREYKTHFYIRNRYNRGSDSLIGMSDCKSKEKNIKVDSINNLLKNHLVNIPKIIKIDVEGYEYKVIKGMSSILKDYNSRGFRLTSPWFSGVFNPLYVKPRSRRDFMGFSESSSPVIIFEANPFILKKEGDYKDILNYLKNQNNYSFYKIDYENGFKKLIKINKFYKLNKITNIYCLIDSHINLIIKNNYKNLYDKILFSKLYRD
jgi:FkbM family methyltransferase